MYKKNLFEWDKAIVCSSKKELVVTFSHFLLLLIFFSSVQRCSIGGNCFWYNKLMSSVRKRFFFLVPWSGVAWKKICQYKISIINCHPFYTPCVYDLNNWSLSVENIYVFINWKGKNKTSLGNVFSLVSILTIYRILFFNIVSLPHAFVGIWKKNYLLCAAHSYSV